MGVLRFTRVAVSDFNRQSSDVDLTSLEDASSHHFELRVSTLDSKQAAGSIVKHLQCIAIASPELLPWVDHFLRLLIPPN